MRRRHSAPHVGLTTPYVEGSVWDTGMTARVVRRGRSRTVEE